MNYNTDGFNERMNYINNANGKNRLNKMTSNTSDSSVVKMRINENKPDIKTVNTDKIILKAEAKGNRENFVLRNNNMNNVNRNTNQNNPVSNAMIASITITAKSSINVNPFFISSLPYLLV